MYQPKTNLRNPRNTTIPILETQIRGRESSPHQRVAWAHAKAWVLVIFFLQSHLISILETQIRGRESSPHQRVAWAHAKAWVLVIFFLQSHLISIFSDVLVVFFLQSRSSLSFLFLVFFFSGSPLMFWSDLFLFIRVINRVLERLDFHVIATWKNMPHRT